MPTVALTTFVLWYNLTDTLTDTLDNISTLGTDLDEVVRLVEVGVRDNRHTTARHRAHGEPVGGLVERKEDVIRVREERGLGQWVGGVGGWGRMEELMGMVGL